MSNSNIAVFGLYSNLAEVESALGELQERGFRNEDVSVLVPDNTGSKQLATQKASKAPEGAVAGAGTGALVGGALGWLAAIGALTIPGVGPFLAAGPIVAALAGAGAGGIAGGLTGGLVGLGLPEFEAKRFEGQIRTGGILLSVHCDNSDWEKRAKDILKHSGAADIAATREASADYGQSDRPRPAPPLMKEISEELRPEPRVGDPAGMATESERNVCKLCGKSFATTAELVAHEVTSHPNVNRAPASTSDLPPRDDDKVA